MADFKTAHSITAKVEGGYSNDKDDNGGETFAGISRKNFPNWKGWAIIDKSEKKDSVLFANSELQQLVLDFYKSSFWDVLSLDKLTDQRVANELYDTAVNMGINRAGVFFQRCLNAVNRNGAIFADLKVDGVIGQKSVDAFNGLSLNDKYMVWKLLNCLQGAKYIEICEANPVQEKFMRSWASRVFETIS